MAKTKFKLIDLCNKLPWVAGAFFFINFVGAWIFSAVEGVGYWNSLYWAFITSLSVGYGDYSPATLRGQALAVFLAASVLLVIIPLLVGIFVTKTIKNQHEYTDDEQKLDCAKTDAILTALGIDPTTIKGV